MAKTKGHVENIQNKRKGKSKKGKVELHCCHSKSKRKQNTEEEKRTEKRSRLKKQSYIYLLI